MKAERDRRVKWTEDFHSQCFRSSDGRVVTYTALAEMEPFAGALLLQVLREGPQPSE